MEIYFNSKKQANIFKKACDAICLMHNFNIEDVLLWMFDKVNLEYVKELKEIIYKKKKQATHVGEFLNIDLNEVSENKHITIDDKFISKLCSNIDILIRIWLGQWENLKYIDKKNFTNEEEKQIYVLRNKIVPLFNEAGINNDYSSFGITSKELKEDLRIIYDIYKVLMYEDGAGGCYAFKPTNFSKCKLPFAISLKEKYYFKTQEEILRFGKKYKGDKVFMDGDDVYAYLEENVSRKILLFNTIFRKKNGYYVFCECINEANPNG